ncbi:MAG: hypothetical protein QOH85_975, partial [Acidobacteriaceae bacterium]|nr:hypothetical protein [Acidobacteriaceae bacterium]
MIANVSIERAPSETTVGTQSLRPQEA